MNELINKYKEMFKNDDCEEQITLYNLFEKLLNKFEPLTQENYDNHPDKIAEGLKKIDYYDFCYAYFLCLYDWDSFTELKLRVMLLLDFICNPKIPEEKKKEYIELVVNKVKEKTISNNNTYFNHLEKTILNSFKNSGKDIVDNIYFLVENEELHFYNYTYLYIKTALYYNEKMQFTKEKVKFYRNLIDKKCLDYNTIKYDKKYDELFCLNSYITLGKIIKEHGLDRLEDFKEAIKLHRKENNKMLKNMNANIDRIKLIFKKDLISKTDIEELKKILNNEELFNLALIEVFKHNNSYIEACKTKVKFSTRKVIDLFRNYKY